MRVEDLSFSNVSDMSVYRDQEQAELPRCECGHDRHHYMVSAQNHHTFARALILMLGISVEPVKVTFQCRKCWKVFDETTDPKDLRAAVGTS
jgi:hypothetical protein